MRRDFLRMLQRKVAISALPASALRGQGHKGLTKSAREYLAEVNLEPFGISNTRRFRARLDRKTKDLIRHLPARARRWGVARKALNLFLRDCFYNHYLRRRFKLERAEHCLEIPLDQIVASGLQSRLANSLPSWPGVKHLTPDISATYQDAAKRVAHKQRLSRVDLDVYLWTERT